MTKRTANKLIFLWRRTKLEAYYSLFFMIAKKYGFDMTVSDLNYDQSNFVRGGWDSLRGKFQYEEKFVREYMQFLVNLEYLLSDSNEPHYDVWKWFVKSEIALIKSKCSSAVARLEVQKIFRAYESRRAKNKKIVVDASKKTG